VLAPEEAELVTPDISPLRRLSLLWVLRRYLERGERIVADGPVRDLDIYRNAYVLVTATRLLLCYASDADTVYTVRFGDVQKCLHRRGAVKLTARAPGMLDPDEAYELTIDYGTQRTLESAIIDGLQRHSPLFRFSEETAARFQRAAKVEIARWLTCPACVGELDQRVEHAAHCSRCGRYYADASLKPIVGQTNSESGRLVGVEPRGSDMSGVFGVVRPFVLREAEETIDLVVDRTLDRVEPGVHRA
jgi:hypothetical protein